MHTLKPSLALPLAWLMLAAAAPSVYAQPAPEEDARRIQSKLDELRQAIDRLGEDDPDPRLLADVEVCAKAAEWILRHDEFYKPEYVDHTLRTLETGLKRAGELAEGQPGWTQRPGTTVLGYVSRVDGSVQPYALTLPDGFDPNDAKRRPLHVVLHGRDAGLNEVSFIQKHEGRPAPQGRDWVQLDVFGRTNNGYRWAGEADVLEALEDAKRRVRIDHRRITLHGFSMGGAGAWHLGLHYPSKWSSVGAGAGFVDFYRYQNVKEPLPEHQDQALRIYDAVHYAMNAYNVPVVAYGGELDPQLQAAKIMAAEAEKHGVEIKLLVGPQTEHKFHPDSLREFMDFHRRHSEQGRPAWPGRESVRFTTQTVKYNQCEWLTIEEMFLLYQPAVVEAEIDRDGTLVVTTDNVATLRISRDVASLIEIDGTLMPLGTAADGLLPDVYYEKGSRGWRVLDYDTSRLFPRNPELRKRRDLQGPIDDAFMQPFVCVRGTGEPWSAGNAAWAAWTLGRFEREFDKWFRGRVPVVDDADVTAELIRERNLVLFGDPGSNELLARVLDELPVRWTEDAIEVNGRQYDPATHGLSLIFPNPLNRERYVVVNSGHTFHEPDFKASNARLFPRLGDIAVQKFAKRADGGYDETVEWATMFNAGWRLPEAVEEQEP